MPRRNRQHVGIRHAGKLRGIKIRRTMKSRTTNVTHEAHAAVHVVDHHAGMPGGAVSVVQFQYRLVREPPLANELPH